MSCQAARCARLVQWLGVMLVLCLTLTGCSGRQHTSKTSFVGKWQSSKLSTPLFLYDNGEWEIKRDEGGVLQYGVWEYREGYLVWYVKLGGRLEKDVNAVLSVAPQEFRLQERDGVSVFTRIE